MRRVALLLQLCAAFSICYPVLWILFDLHLAVAVVHATLVFGRRSCWYGCGSLFICMLSYRLLMDLIVCILPCRLLLSLREDVVIASVLDCSLMGRL
jgi:hypothetical protein